MQIQIQIQNKQTATTTITTTKKTKDEGVTLNRCLEAVDIDDGMKNDYITAAKYGFTDCSIKRVRMMHFLHGIINCGVFPFKEVAQIIPMQWIEVAKVLLQQLALRSDPEQEIATEWYHANCDFLHLCRTWTTTITELFQRMPTDSAQFEAYKDLHTVSYVFN